jgi:hypothetical protein
MSRLTQPRRLRASTPPSPRTRAHSLARRRELECETARSSAESVARTIDDWAAARDRHLAEAQALDDRIFELLRVWTR